MLIDKLIPEESRWNMHLMVFTLVISDSHSIALGWFTILFISLFIHFFSSPSLLQVQCQHHSVLIVDFECFWITFNNTILDYFFPLRWFFISFFFRSKTRNFNPLRFCFNFSFLLHNVCFRVRTWFTVIKSRVNPFVFRTALPTTVLNAPSFNEKWSSFSYFSGLY